MKKRTKKEAKMKKIMKASRNTSQSKINRLLRTARENNMMFVSAFTTQRPGSLFPPQHSTCMEEQRANLAFSLKSTKTF